MQWSVHSDRAELVQHLGTFSGLRWALWPDCASVSLRLAQNKFIALGRAYKLRKQSVRVSS